MHVWWSDDYPRMYPVPATIIVVAPDEQTARAMMREKMDEAHLDREHFNVHRIDQDRAHVVKFDDGNY